jgi:tetratricopeptide (TPR) repeat protein
LSERTELNRIGSDRFGSDPANPRLFGTIGESPRLVLGEQREPTPMPIDLNAALDLHRRGQWREAAALYEAALRENPGRAEAYHGLGIIASQSGDPARSVGLLEKAVALAPERATFVAGLGDALWAMHELDRSIAAYRRSLELDSDQPGVLCNLGASLVDRGDLEGGIACFREAIRLQPSLAAAHNNLGRALRVRGETQQALEHLRQAVQLDPASLDARGNLSRILLERGDAAEALPHAIEAVKSRPDLPDGLVHLGNVLYVLGRLDEAQACHREALRLTPGHASAHAALAGVQEQLGDLEPAFASLRGALRNDPQHAGALARLASRLRARLPDADRAKIAARLADPSLSLEQRISLLFGLAQVHDDRGEFDQAAERSIEANALQAARLARLGRAYDPEAHRQFIDQLIEACSPAFFERVRGWGDRSERPVFVVGLPRSGTSLVDQILASHGQIHGAGELVLVRDLVRSLPALRVGSTLAECLAQLDREPFQALAQGYLDAVAAIDSASPRLVDKMPENLLYLGLIAALLPGARIIHCRRDLRDVALSCWMTEFTAVRWAFDAGQITSRIRESQRIGEHWQRVLPTRVLDVHYERLVTDLEPVARQLVAWCGLDWDPACLNFHNTRRAVRTASAVQVRQPAHTRSLMRWKNYASLLPSLFSGIPEGD